MNETIITYFVNNVIIITLLTVFASALIYEVGNKLVKTFKK